MCFYHYRDSLIVGVGNVCTSIYAGFVIFSIVGYLAKELETPIDTVVDEGKSRVVVLNISWDSGLGLHSLF